MPAHTVTVRFFAVLRERSGVDRMTVTSDAETLRDLYAELSARLPLGLDEKLVKFAANGQFVPETTPLTGIGEVALIPPVAGG